MIHVFEKLSLYGMYNVYLIFGHFRQFPIFNLWVRPVWFSTLQLYVNCMANRVITGAWRSPGSS